nr:MAG TPA: hypothetical protein [Crassvirales sp.]
MWEFPTGRHSLNVRMPGVEIRLTSNKDYLKNYTLNDF